MSEIEVGDIVALKTVRHRSMVVDSIEKQRKWFRVVAERATCVWVEADGVMNWETFDVRTLVKR